MFRLGLYTLCFCFGNFLLSGSAIAEDSAEVVNAENHSAPAAAAPANIGQRSATNGAPSGVQVPTCVNTQGAMAYLNPSQQNPRPAAPAAAGNAATSATPTQSPVQPGQAGAGASNLASARPAEANGSDSSSAEPSGGDAAKGAKVYDEKCMSCHKNQTPEVQEKFKNGNKTAAIDNGSMPKKPGPSLSPQEKNDVKAFLNGT